MPPENAGQVTNDLINALPDRERLSLLALSEPVDLISGEMLCEVDQVFRYVYFPLSGFISQVAQTIDHRPLEMGLIGSEGMLGATLVLGIADAPLRAVVQGSGTAFRLETTQLVHELQDSPGLQRVLHRYVSVTMAQLAQTAVCNCFHEVDARLARWLLMTHDRAHADRFQLTHQFLADMLGVQRGAVSIAAATLQQKGLIHYTRGDITLLDRIGLEAESCLCYRAMVNNHLRLFSVRPQTWKTH